MSRHSEKRQTNILTGLRLMLPVYFFLNESIMLRLLITYSDK